MKVKHNLFFQILFCIGLSILFSSCSVKKHLKTDQYLVTNNAVILIDTTDAIKEKSQLKYELSKLINQKENSKLLFFFKTELFLHYKTKPVEALDPNDVSAVEEGFKIKFRRWFRRHFTEEPVLHDENFMDDTALRMQNYLNNRGYLDAKVYTETKKKERAKKAEVTYVVNPGEPYYIDKLIFESRDSTIKSLLPWIKKESHLKEGDNLDFQIYGQEVQRITDSLRNNGYAYFYPSYVDQLEADTTNGKHSLTVYSNIKKPIEDTKHRKYKFGEINVYTNYIISDTSAVLEKRTSNGINYFALDGDLGVRENVIAKNIFIKNGEDFNQSLINKTNKQLRALGMYKFVNIKQFKSQTDPLVIDFQIILTKAKKHNITIQADINNSERVLVNNSSANYIGTLLNVSFQDNNAFKGAENVNIAMEVGVEFNLTNPAQQLISSLDLLGRYEILLPEFVDIPGTWKFLSWLKFGKFRALKPAFYQDLKEKSKPVGSISFNKFNLLDLYSFTSMEASWGYDLKRNNNEHFRINTLGFTLFQSNLSDSLRMQITSPFTLRSFEESQLFTGLFYTDMNYVWTSNPNILGETWQLRFNHELSGAEVLIANMIANGGKKPFTITGRDFRFSHFTKGSFDARYFKNYTDGNSLAMRAVVGLAAPYSGLTNTVPFVKQFSVGGPNSIRAWRIRELGPGSFYDPSIQNPPFYQTGDFKVEFNAEYRFKFIPFFAMDGAIFIDGGNVWTLRQDSTRLGSQLRWRSEFNPDDPDNPIGGNFINQLALGTGFGIRIDFTYVVLRFDIGLRMRSPYINKTGSNWYFEQWVKGDFSDLLNYNLALGFPF